MPACVFIYFDKTRKFVYIYTAKERNEKGNLININNKRFASNAKK